MQNEEIQELTASLPLTIEEEYRMQQTWLNDQDKCTFIILSRELFEQTHDEIGTGSGRMTTIVLIRIRLSLASMIGDVNLFFNDQDDPHCGEIEIMIAEPSARQKGFAIETLQTFLRYGKEHFLSLQWTSYLLFSDWNPSFTTCSGEDRPEECTQYCLVLEEAAISNSQWMNRSIFSFVFSCLDSNIRRLSRSDDGTTCEWRNDCTPSEHNSWLPSGRLSELFKRIKRRDLFALHSQRCSIQSKNQWICACSVQGLHCGRSLSSQVELVLPRVLKVR